MNNPIKIKNEDSLTIERLTAVPKKTVKRIDIDNKTPEQVDNLISKWKEKIKTSNRTI